VPSVGIALNADVSFVGFSRNTKTKLNDLERRAQWRRRIRGGSMKKKLFGVIVGVFLFAGYPALATTYIYTGLSYDFAPVGVSDPINFGTFMTGSVTLNCNLCSDGTYHFNDPIVTSFQLISGSYTQPLSAFTAFLSSDYITIQGGTVNLWAIDSLNTLPLSAPFFSIELITANTATAVIDEYETCCFLQGGLFGGAIEQHAGSWTTASVGAIPEPSTWAMMLIGFAGTGLLCWRRKRKAAAPAAA
jgi:PEP-CTERM motif